MLSISNSSPFATEHSADGKTNGRTAGFILLKFNGKQNVWRMNKIEKQIILKDQNIQSFRARCGKQFHLTEVIQSIECSMVSHMRLYDHMSLQMPNVESEVAKSTVEIMQQGTVRKQDKKQKVVDDHLLYTETELLECAGNEGVVYNFVSCKTEQLKDMSMWLSLPRFYDIFVQHDSDKLDLQKTPRKLFKYEGNKKERVAEETDPLLKSKRINKLK